ncbi:MAG: hypothetical protein GC159_03400 [Phycisphaera sp.]|nr:hypothetical protein [Phycisphaera sp.]
MTRDELHMLLDRYADGTLDDVDTERLLNALSDKRILVEARRELETMRLLHRHEAEADGEVFRRSLVERLRAENDGDRFVEQWRREDDELDALASQTSPGPRATGGRARQQRHPALRRRRSSVGGWIGLAAAVTIVAIGAWLIAHVNTAPSPTIVDNSGDGTPADPSAASIATLTQFDGDVTIHRGDREVTPDTGMSLHSGDRLTCGSDARAAWRYADGTSLGAESGSVVVLSDTAAGKRVWLERGRITGDVAKQPADAPFAMETPGAVATVLGTRLTLATSTEGSRLEVTEGRVRFERRSDRASVEVAAGHYAVASTGVTLDVLPIPPRVDRLVLVDATANRDIRPVRDNDVIDLSRVGRSLNIRAEVVGGVGSVRFKLDDNALRQVENVPIYSLAGDIDGDYKAWRPSVGAHTLTITPYADPQAKGSAGEAMTIRFRVIDGVDAPR